MSNPLDQTDQLSQVQAESDLDVKEREIAYQSTEEAQGSILAQ